MANTVVHMVRHGEVRNPQRVLYGRLPGFALSARGEEQALAVAKYLSGRSITHVVCSPLERARQTAEPISEFHHIEPVVDDRLVESANVFEGRRVGLGDVAWGYPRGWLKLYNPLRPSWSEPFTEIAQRMLAVLHHVRRAATGAEAACVSHQLPIWILRRICEGRHLWHDPRRRQCSVASVTSFEFSDEQLIRIIYREPGAEWRGRVIAHPAIRPQERQP